MKQIRFVILGLGFAAFAFCFLDHPLSSFIHSYPWVGELHNEIVSVFGALGHGMGVLAIGATIYVLDEANRRSIPRFLICAYLPGFVAGVMKLFVCRIRPREFDFGFSIYDSVLGFFPFYSLSSDFQSFPSGHSATGFGLAVGLSWLYPKGKLLFFAFAALIACQRIVSESHFLSDTICGAMLGILISRLCLYNCSRSNFADEIEKKT